MCPWIALQNDVKEPVPLTPPDWYGAKLTSGHYRVLARGYTSFDGLQYARAEEAAAIAVEFQIA